MICHLIKPQYRFVMTIKDKDMKITISEIVERNGTLNEKVVLVNGYLSKICQTIGLPIIKHHNFKPELFEPS